MSQPSIVIDAQSRALITLLQREQAEACAREAAGAATRARDTVRAAHFEARRLVHEAIQDERNRRDVALAQARAGVETRRRQAAQREASRVVEAAWTRMPDALRALWLDTAQRRGWCRAAIVSAARVLQMEHWDINCATQIPEAELQSIRQFARDAGVHDVQARVRPAIDAGLTIGSAGATVDATLGGLLSARQVIEAELHAQYLAEALR